MNQKTAKVFVVNNGVAQQKEVQIHKIEDDRLLINNGLADGDAVVIRGAGYLANDDKVVVSSN